MALKRIHENSRQPKELNSFSHEWFINMILKDLKIFSQNVQKNNFLINTMLWQPLITKTNDHTNGKSLSWISSREFTRELDKESLLN